MKVDINSLLSALVNVCFTILNRLVLMTISIRVPQLYELALLLACISWLNISYEEDRLESLKKTKCTVLTLVYGRLDLLTLALTFGGVESGFLDFMF